MRRTSQGLGFSLVEVLLVAALMLVLLTLIVQVVVPMSKGSVRASEQVGLQQLASVALERMTQELQACPRPALVSFPPAAPGDPPVRLALHPMGGVGPSGDQFFPNQYFFYWLDTAEHRLWRAPWQRPFGFDDAPSLVPTVTQFETARTTPPPGTRVAAADVKEFEVTLLPLKVQLRLLLEHPAPDGRPPEQFELRRDVVLPNGLY